MFEQIFDRRRAGDSIQPTTAEAAAAWATGIGIAVGVHFRDFLPYGVSEAILILALATLASIRMRIRIDAIITLSVFPLAALISIAASGSEADAVRYASMIGFGALSAIILSTLRCNALVLAGKVFVMISAIVAAISSVQLVLFTWGLDVFQVTNHGSPAYARSEGFIEGPNYFAMSMAFAVAVSLLLNRYRRWGTLFTAVLIVGVLASGSRGIIVALATFAVVLLLSDREYRTVLKWAGLPGALGGAIMYLAMAPASMTTIIGNRFLDSTGGGAARVKELASAVSGAHGEVAILGAGRTDFAANGIAPHNAYITILFDYGIFGLAAFILPMLLTTFLFLNNARTRSIYPFAIAILLAFAAVFNDYHLTREWWLGWGLAWLIYGIAPEMERGAAK